MGLKWSNPRLISFGWLFLALPFGLRGVRLDLEQTHRLTRGPRGHLGGKLGGAEQVQGRG